MLRVQVGVPQEELYSDDPARFIFSAMREAVPLAAPAFKKTKIPFSAEAQLSLVDEVERRFRNE
jgi:hypothetical protein